jgi:hypothetical protein
MDKVKSLIDQVRVLDGDDEVVNDNCLRDGTCSCTKYQSG